MKLNSITVWDTVNEITNFRCIQKDSICKFIHNDSVITDKQQMSDLLFNEYVVKHNESAASVDDVVISDLLVQYEHQNLKDADYVPTQTITPDEVESAIKGVNVARNSFTHIPDRILRHFRFCLSIPLALFFSTLFTISKFPIGFKASTINPLYKGKGKKTCASFYRPIIDPPY